MDEKRFAILIDGENISPKYIKTILDEISNKGTATYKRIYGDWTTAALGGWKEKLLDYSISPMQQYSYTTGKNSSDSAMIIDAMDILYSGKVEGFCLATSDSDFTKLAARLRESGMIVIGMGEEKTPRPFVSACDEFKFVDKLSEESENIPRPRAKKAEPPVKNEKRQVSKAPAKKSAAETSQTDLDTITSTILKLISENSDEDGYMPLSDIGNKLSKRHPDFDVRNFGCRKMLPLLNLIGLFELKKVRDKSNKKNPNAELTYVKIKE